MRFRLRTLLIVLALGPPMLAGAWHVYRHFHQPRYPQLSYSFSGGIED